MNHLKQISVWAMAALLSLAPLQAQGSQERAFPQSKATVEKALKALQANMSGHLPALEGFAQSGEHPLDQYKRGFYQTQAEVVPGANGGSVVRVSTKITAWYSDAPASHSGYQLLQSNGRLESDLLEQLADELGKTSSTMGASAKTVQPAPVKAATANSSKASGMPDTSTKAAEPDPRFSSAMKSALVPPSGSRPLEEAKMDAANSELQEEARNLEELLKNQSHPKNLVAVKKSGTPVVGSPSLTAKPLFMASQHDEFEMLDFNADWVHVRVSGLSRGWIWRNSLEMPDGIGDTQGRSAAALAPVADLFHVVREETAPFPGDWEPLRGKNVKIISVQKNEENSQDSGPKARLEYAKSLLLKSYADLAQKPQEMLGVVVIFDSSDGGMIAATFPTLQQWKAGNLSDAAMWHKCFFDPPETFESAGSGGTQ